MLLRYLQDMERLKMNSLQPSSVYNYTKHGYEASRLKERVTIEFAILPFIKDIAPFFAYLLFDCVLLNLSNAS